MTAGLNAECVIYRMSSEPDDVVGGASITGTVVHENVLTRLEANPTDQLFLQQGLETIRTFNAIVVPGTLDVRERDEYEITAPNDHVYYGDRFRIVGRRWSSHAVRDRRNYLMLSLVRTVKAHATQ